MIVAKTQNKDRQLAEQVRTRNGQLVQIKPFAYTTDGYRAIVAIRNAVDTQYPQAVADWQHWDENREAQYLFRRYVVERDGEVVAFGNYGHMPWSHHPDKYYVNVMVHPDAQRQGIGSTFYEFLRRRLNRLRPRKLVANTRENRPGAMRFLEKRGFQQVMREEVSRLDPVTFDAARFAEKMEQVRASGVEIKTLAELQVEDPDWKRKTYDVDWECLKDVPSTDPFTRRSFEAFEKQTLENPCLLPDAWFIAVDGDDYVGLSVLWRNLATDDLLETGLTGVIRSHRRRGIATAMKVKAIEYAQAHGNAAIDTDNEENNPMFQINLALGFKPLPAFLDYEKKLAPAHDWDSAKNKQATVASQSPV